MRSKMIKVQFFVLLVAALTIPHTASGQVTEEWVARYDGPQSRGDRARAITVDANGNVYVTGESEGPGEDYVTIKYDASGNELWVARYDGPTGGGGVAVAITADVNGNVYVTGSSPGVGTGYDYATIKYGASGSQLWVARYDGPTSDQDNASAITIDDDGNVYVTGTIRRAGTNYDYDYATIKYDANGNELWVARYDGPSGLGDWARDLGVDAAGNVYVTGESASGTRDYTTIKYNASGSQLWVARYNGLGNISNGANAIAVDTNGNVYVTGYSDGSSTGYDYATIKYDTNGIELWVTRYDGSDSIGDGATAIAIDANNNVCVTGYSDGTGSGHDYATIRYDADGNQLWAARYNGPADASDFPNSVAVDTNGNVYVTGFSESSSSGEDYATIKYDANGNELWVARYNGTGSTDDRPYDMALDVNDNVYVTGFSAGEGTQGDCATIKYSQSNTPPGSPVIVEPEDCPGGIVGGTPVTVTFDTVTIGGNTTLCTSNNPPTPPSGFRLVPPDTYYEINTTATYSGNIRLCIRYDPADINVPEGNLTIWHEETGWHNVTCPEPPPNPNTAIHEICGCTTSVSPFAIFEPDVLGVDIDIKPGSDSNCINNNGHGVIPVAIFGSADLDVNDILVDSIGLNSVGVRAVGKGNKYLAHYEDVNGDNYGDLIVQIEDQDGVFTEGTSTARITGGLINGTTIEGTDTICIVP